MTNQLNLQFDTVVEIWNEDSGDCELCYPTADEINAALDRLNKRGNSPATCVVTLYNSTCSAIPYTDFAKTCGFIQNFL